MTLNLKFDLHPPFFEKTNVTIKLPVVDLVVKVCLLLLLFVAFIRHSSSTNTLTFFKLITSELQKHYRYTHFSPKSLFEGANVLTISLRCNQSIDTHIFKF